MKISNWKPFMLYTDEYVGIILDFYRKSIDTVTLKYITEDAGITAHHLNDTAFDGGW